jgi:PPK2 family polyphosphate:nucleotide phosphotransferase
MGKKDHGYVFTVEPGDKFRLDRIDPEYTADFDDKDDVKKRLKQNLEHLKELQEQLYASCDQSLLIVVQAMDTAGKDGAIEHVMGAFNPQGVVVTPFKVPSEEELAHDFLWRVHKATPRKGMIAIFNRSHYEDVLVVRVKKIVPKDVWKDRYDQINAFEELLAANGTRIVKIFLHITPDEQAERLRARQDTPEKQWKFSPGDLEDRKLWHDYQEAYEDALRHCNTDHGPWYVVPANHKWYRNLAVSELLIEVMESMDLSFPEPVDDVTKYEIPEV